MPISPGNPMRLPRNMLLPSDIRTPILGRPTPFEELNRQPAAVPTVKRLNVGTVQIDRPRQTIPQPTINAEGTVTVPTVRVPRPIQARQETIPVRGVIPLPGRSISATPAAARVPVLPSIPLPAKVPRPGVVRLNTTVLPSTKAVPRGTITWRDPDTGEIKQVTPSSGTNWLSGVHPAQRFTRHDRPDDRTMSQEQEYADVPALRDVDQAYENIRRRMARNTNSPIGTEAYKDLEIAKNEARLDAINRELGRTREETAADQQRQNDRDRRFLEEDRQRDIERLASNKNLRDRLEERLSKSAAHAAGFCLSLVDQGLSDEQILDTVGVDILEKAAAYLSGCKVHFDFNRRGIDKSAETKNWVAFPGKNIPTEFPLKDPKKFNEAVKAFHGILVSTPSSSLLGRLLDYKYGSDERAKALLSNVRGGRIPVGDLPYWKKLITNISNMEREKKEEGLRALARYGMTPESIKNLLARKNIAGYVLPWGFMNVPAQRPVVPQTQKTVVPQTLQRAPQRNEWKTYTTDVGDAFDAPPQPVQRAQQQVQIQKQPAVIDPAQLREFKAYQVKNPSWRESPWMWLLPIGLAGLGGGVGKDTSGSTSGSIIGLLLGLMLMRYFRKGGGVPGLIKEQA